jgi:undecaprenyl phosphate-alpha-L-ara4N flippase subunit ArnE
MNSSAFLVLVGTILCDIIGQLCFKAGLDSADGGDATRLVWLKVATTPLIWLGMATYAIEIGAWLFVLSRMPLSLAFPLASLSYCGIALASRFILKEPVSQRRWLGTALIALGVAIVGSST